MLIASSRFHALPGLVLFLEHVRIRMRRGLPTVVPVNEARQGLLQRRRKIAHVMGAANKAVRINNKNNASYSWRRTIGNTAFGKLLVDPEVAFLPEITHEVLF